MPRDYILYLEDIVEASNKIQRYLGDYSFEQFIEDEKTVDAVTRNLEIIGIAAKSIPQDVKDRYPEIQWRKVYLFRNVLAHEYFGINKDVLWEIISQKVPELSVQVESILNKES
ncbi:MAG: DUF86 domain-containing protein [Thermodesulfovibrionales bacterium]|nr:DUF86 domain-containing protein [Thermodesulfovibrionales bacterium]